MTTLTAQEIMLLIVGVSAGIVSYPVMIMLVGPLVKFAMRPWGAEKLPFTFAVFAIAALAFLIFAFFGIAAIWTKLSVDASGSEWKPMARFWGMGWFAGLCLFALIPGIERKLRRQARKRKPRVAG
jgi:hypothetical protein